MPAQKPLAKRRKRARHRVILWVTMEGLPIGYLVRPLNFRTPEVDDMLVGPFETEEEALQYALAETQRLADLAQARLRGVKHK